MNKPKKMTWNTVSIIILGVSMIITSLNTLTIKRRQDKLDKRIAAMEIELVALKADK